MQDVIVIGGGPAGNSTALRLATLGHQVSVIDWRTDLGDKLCSGIVGLACANQFTLDPALVYREARAATVFSPNGHGTRFARDEVQAYVIDRVRYVAAIGERAADRGAQYYLGQRVSGLKCLDDRVVVDTVAGSKVYTYEAKTAVIASGFGTALTTMAGLGSTRDYAVGVQAEVSAPAVGEVEVYFGNEVAPEFFAWLVPTTGGRALLGLLSRRQAGVYWDRLTQRLRAEGKVAGVDQEPSQWAVPLSPLSKTYGERLLVVGDAAGQVKPTTGGGIYYALVAGGMAADTLAEALRLNDFSAAMMGNYESEWKKLLKRELEVGYSSRRLFERLTDRQLNFLLRLVARTGLHRDMATLPASAFDWHSSAVVNLLKHPIVGKFLRLAQPVASRLTRDSLEDGEYPPDPETLLPSQTGD